jgi:hypothetical protein
MRIIDKNRMLRLSPRGHGKARAFSTALSNERTPDRHDAPPSSMRASGHAQFGVKYTF